jgi:hypothetical protein
MSRATIPLVSVTMAWAREMPGVRTPPTVVKAPNLKTSLRLSGLNSSDDRWTGILTLVKDPPGFYSRKNHR